MRKYFEFVAVMILAMTCGTFVITPAMGQQLLGGFEQTLASTAGGAPFDGQWTAPPDYTTSGVTEGSRALALHHATDWVTDGFKLSGGMALAQQTAAHDFLQFDVTT